MDFLSLTTKPAIGLVEVHITHSLMPLHWVAIGGQQRNPSTNASPLPSASFPSPRSAAM